MGKTIELVLATIIIFIFDVKKFLYKLLLQVQVIVVGGAVASWLVRSSPDRVVRVRALAGDIVLCSWARHLTLSSPGV